MTNIQIQKLQKQLKRYKTIALAFAMLAGVLAGLILGQLAWQVTDPFGYNDFITEHTLLPVIVEPNLTMHPFNDLGTNVYLDPRENELFFIWSTEQQCWGNGTGCWGDTITVSNDSRNVFAVTFKDNQGVADLGTCLTIDTINQDGDISYLMPPGCAVRLYKQTDNWADFKFIPGLPKTNGGS